MIKKICKKLINCITGLFRTEKDEYNERLIELQQIIRQQKIRSVRVNQSMIGHKYDDSDQEQKKESKNSSKDSERSNADKQVKQIHQKILKEQVEDQKKVYSPQHRNKQKSQKQTKLTKSISHLNKKHSNKLQKNQGKKLQAQSEKLKQRMQRASNNSSDSFYTLQSGSGSSYSISRRTFRSIRSSIKSGKIFNSKKNSSSQFKSMGNRASFAQYKLSPNMTDIEISGKKLSEIMMQWNQRQYQKLQITDSSNIQGQKQSLNRFSFQSISSGQEYEHKYQTQIQRKNKYKNPKQSSASKPTASKLKIQNSKQKMSPILRQKLNTNSLLDQVINKIQDYYTFYSNQQLMNIVEQEKTNSLSLQEKKRKILKTQFQKLEPLKGYYYNKATGLKGSYHSQSQNLSSSSNTYLKLLSFKCNTTNPLYILHWYNSVETKIKLFDFHKITMVENGIYPIFQVQQYSRYFKQKNVYTIIKQIDLGKFDGQAQKQFVLQMDMTIGKGGQTNDQGMQFRSLLKFEIAQNGLVQIYYQSNQDIQSGFHGPYFKERWTSFEKNMQKQGILKEYVPVIQH